jgi:hypothetical protein
MIRRMMLLPVLVDGDGEGVVFCVDVCVWFVVLLPYHVVIQ